MSGADLAHWIGRAVVEPLRSRRSLHAALLRSPTYLLHVGAQILGQSEVRVLRGRASFSIWADVDPVFESVWVPLFTQRNHLSAYIARRGLKPPNGKTFQWMRHDPGKAYAIVQTIRSFAGILLDPNEAGIGVRLDWPEVDALSKGRLPREAPILHQFPVPSYPMPEGTQCVLARSSVRWTGVGGRQALFSGIDPVEGQDYRKLVRLRLDNEDNLWTPCRHFAMAMRRFLDQEHGETGPHVDALMRSLLEFQMYGEAEAFCLQVATQEGHQAYAWTFLSEVYRRTGHLEQCIEACQRGLEESPQEKLLYVNQATAHAQMEDLAAARAIARLGLAHFPDDPSLQRFL